MTRWILALVPLLLACDSGQPSDPDASTEDASPRDSSTHDAEMVADSDSLGADADSQDADSDSEDAHDTDADSSDADVESDGGPVGDPGPRYVGRHDDSDPTAVRLSWSGSGLVVRFDGTAVRVTMNDSARYFSLIVDGELQPTFVTSAGSQTYELASGLSEDVHTVELYRRTESFYGPTIVTDVEVDGELLGVPLPSRRIEVVGDSISAGYGVDGEDQYCSFSAETENHYLTYGAIAARIVGAELSTVAWSGKGVVNNYGDDVVEPMPQLYDRVIATEADSTGVIRPADVVVVNLGTNDFSTDGDPTEAQFVPAYLGLLSQVRAQHPDATIFCTVAPMLSGDDEARARAYIQSVVTDLTSGGDPNIRWLEIDDTIEDWGCDWHPGDETQARMAEDLVVALETELGW